MTLNQNLSELRQNFERMGARRLAVLSVLAVAVFTSVMGGAYFLSTPAMVVLYSGLEAEDVNAIGSALKETGYPFDVSSDGKSVLTGASDASRARMMLAERGLPQSSSAGYELFDKMGSLGLTSFMQDVTMVRALEGELARTIQSMRGIKSARVHLVMPERSSFRRRSKAASASVVIRQNDGENLRRANSVRYLVAAAVPGMSVSQVAVLDATGKLLASGDDGVASAPNKLMDLEKTHSDALTDRLRQTLAPHLGVGNFNVSVSTKLNTDKRQVNEKIFDPEGRVERSLRSVRETDERENSQKNDAVTVQADIPSAPTAGSGESNKQRSEKRDETTNYEINAKTVRSVSEGYKIDNISVAVLINRQVLLDVIGKDSKPEAIEKHLKDIKELLASVAGISLERGDRIVVKTVQFFDNSTVQASAEPSFISSLLKMYTGTAIKSLIVLICAFLLVFAGIKPAVRALLPKPSNADDVAALEGSRGGAQPAIATPGSVAPGGGAAGGVAAGGVGGGGTAEALEGPQLAGVEGGENAPPMAGEKRPTSFVADPRDKPELKLEQLVENDEEQAAIVLKQWLQEGAT